MSFYFYLPHLWSFELTLMLTRLDTLLPAALLLDIVSFEGIHTFLGESPSPILKQTIALYPPLLLRLSGSVVYWKTWVFYSPLLHLYIVIIRVPLR